MCGITGLIPFEKKVDISSAIIKMTAAMAHRGPDAGGYYINDAVALGHRRLSIIDLSTAANQPFANVTNRFHVVFNGELYNYQKVRACIKDHQFRTNSDTEVLTEAFARWGIDCIHHFDGMFAFAVWDDQERELVLVRDRMGVKPLYYYADERGLIFASEIRSILASGLVQARINPEVVADYLSFQSVSSPFSIVDGIQQLEAGHYLVVRNNKITIRKYWSLTDSTPDFDFSDEAGTKKRVRELLMQSVEKRLISDVPIGAFLSGGIDSSAVVGLIAQVSGKSPVTFNVSFAEKDFDESDYANLVAKKFSAKHQRILLSPTAMLDELEPALNSMDTPSGDGINTYVVSKAVKNAGLTVALSGIGGDELFAGYSFFKKFYQFNKAGLLWNNSNLLRHLLSKVVLSSEPKWNKIRRLLLTPSASITDLYPILRSTVSPASIRSQTSIGNQGTYPIVNKLLQTQKHLKDSHRLSQVSIAELMGYTQQTLLKDTDQMSMAVSLEVREPFFDHHLVEFVLNVPDNIKYPTYPKKLLVESLGDLLPRETVLRKKMGFTFPWSVWLRNDLKSFCDQQLKNVCQHSFINGKEVEDTWSKFLKGDKSVSWMNIWLLVVLGYWMEKNGVS